MANTWFVSDTHFFHENIIRFSGRPFESVEEMNDVMVQKWNALVKPADKVYHLGDVAFQVRNRGAELRDLLGSLNGQKELLIGNHDDAKSCVGDYFDKISLWKVFEKWNFFASHIPLESNPDNFRSVSFQVHGHVHQNLVPSPKYINVCVEHTDYAPRHVDSILKEISARSS